ncbi:hypothetical protein MM26B8_02850 [Mycoplasmopsis meleagridis]|nr:hypothetical protein MM26B8_02850 [Mycoplasmopsis meleagridis]
MLKLVIEIGEKTPKSFINFFVFIQLYYYIFLENKKRNPWVLIKIIMS